MKIDIPADFLQKISRNNKAFEAAVTSGDLKTARRLADECVTLFHQLARRVPLREQYYRDQAKEWKKKAEEIVSTTMAGGTNADTDMIDYEVAPGSTMAVRTASLRPPHQIFISYSKPDQMIAKDLCSYLEAQNIPCWIAPRDVLPGSNFPGSIIDAIDQSRVVVLIFSKSSDNSPHVIRELTQAVKRNILILPFRVEEILPTKNMDYLINISQWFDAFPLPAQQYFGMLTDTIKTHLVNSESADPKPGNPGG